MLFFVEEEAIMRYNPFKMLTRFERRLWIISIFVITSSFFISKSGNPLTLVASLVGATSLIFVARGAVIGQILMVIFSIIYAIISVQFHYYGEMITYLGMTAPISVLTVISWIKHPYEGNRSEVKTAKLGVNKTIYMILLTVGITYIFYFILRYFNTENLFFSTVSIATSFLASYLMLFRSTFYAIAYAANDIVLIILWIFATVDNITYFPMIICFGIFFCNDVYGFISWCRMEKRQEK